MGVSVIWMCTVSRSEGSIAIARLEHVTRVLTVGKSEAVLGVARYGARCAAQAAARDVLDPQRGQVDRLVPDGPYSHV